MRIFLCLLCVLCGVVLGMGVPVWADGEEEGESPGVAFEDLTPVEQGPYFAAVEAWGRKGRLECQRRDARLAEISASVLDDQVKSALEAAIVPGFEVSIGLIAGEMPTPGSVRASLAPGE